MWVCALSINDPVLKEKNKTPIVMNTIQGVLVITIQTRLSPSVLEQFKYDILNRLEFAKITYIFFDFSGVAILDIYEFNAIESIMKMAKMMGSQSVIVGLHSGIAASLVLYDIECLSLNTALDVDDAFRRFNTHKS